MPIQQRSQLKGFGQSTNEKYIVEDINDLVTAANNVTPSGPFYLNATGGTSIVNVNTIEISNSILIPANTITTSAVMELLFRAVKNDANTTLFYCYIYKNTVNSISGASLLGTITAGTSSKSYKTNAQRFINYKSSNLEIIDPSFASTTDLESSTSGSISLVSFNPSVDNYILLAVGAASTTATCQVSFSKLEIHD
jgi:hypothetical protein